MAEIKENLISVITVCYNAENNLERTIKTNHIKAHIILVK